MVTLMVAALALAVFLCGMAFAFILCSIWINRKSEK